MEAEKETAATSAAEFREEKPEGLTGLKRTDPVATCKMVLHRIL